MVAFFFLAASALATVPAVLSEPVSSNALFARQAGITPSSIPPACVTPCSTFSKIMSGGGCMDLSCLCTDQVVSGLNACLTCTLNGDTATVTSTLNGFIDTCKQGGFNVANPGSGSAGGSGNSAATTGGLGGAPPATTGGLGGAVPPATGAPGAASPATTGGVGGAAPTTNGAAAATQTSPTGNTLGGTSDAVKGSMSIAGAVFAVIAGFALL